MAAKDRRSRRRPHTVAAVAFPEQAPFELSVPCEVFGLDRSELVAPAPWYEFFVAATQPGPMPTGMGFSLESEYGLAELARADTIIIPAHYKAGDPPVALLDALRTAHARGARIMSFCTGAFILAAAGLLDGRPATTHWMHAERLAAEYPTIAVDPRVLYVDAGDGIYTSAGTAAGIDLCLHIVRLDHGAEVANAVARRMVVPPHRDGGQAQYVDLPVPMCADDDPIGVTLGWMLEHLAQQTSVDELAARSHMSPRTFARRFVAVTGTTPHAWLLSQRILFAQRMLETTDEPIEFIASRSGFGSAANLRHHFGREVSTSPLAYRRTFRSGGMEGVEEEAS
jgi:transcriptional regulator GlxA family with amidase domain